MKKSYIVIGVIAVLALIIFMSYRSSYNKAIGYQEVVDEQWSNVGAQYQRRADLVPQLVATVKGAAENEKGILTQVTEARAGIVNAKTPEDMEVMGKKINTAINLAFEAYPQIRSTENFSELQAELANHYELPMATGENLFSHQDARNLLRHGGMRSDRDYLQFDCALSYGLVEYMRTLKVLEEMGWSSRRVVPHGGHQMSLNIAAGLHLGGNESYPDVFQPFGGFADGIQVENGYVGLPDIPGVGFEAKSALYAVMRELGEG